jgi:CheY-like chemotaxis protein
MIKILIREDNIKIRENTAKLLELNNYQIIVAENGQTGFYLAKKHVPDLILCDMMMPETGGREFLKLAKHSSLICGDPTHLFSAGSLYPDIRMGLIKMSDCYLAKECNRGELLGHNTKGSSAGNIGH